MSLLKQQQYKSILEEIEKGYPNSTTESLCKKFNFSRETLSRRIREFKNNGYKIKVVKENFGSGFTSFYSIDTENMTPLPEVKDLLSKNGDLAFVFAHKILANFGDTPFSIETKEILSKIENILKHRDDDLGYGAQLLAEYISTMNPILPKIDSSIWKDIITSIENTTQLQFTYMKMDGSTDSYSINPYHLFLSDIHFQNSWYLAGFVESKKDFRVFNLSRITEVKALQINFRKSKRANHYPFTNVGDILWQNDMHNFEIEIEKHVIMSFKSTNWGLNEEYKELDNGNFLMSFSTKLSHNIRGWIMSWGKFVKIHKPHQLKDQIRDHVEGILRNLD